MTKSKKVTIDIRILIFYLLFLIMSGCTEIEIVPTPIPTASEFPIPEGVTQIFNQDGYYRGYWSPDGARLALGREIVQGGSDGTHLYQIMILDLQSGETQLIAESRRGQRSLIAWLSNQQIVFYADGDLASGIWTFDLLSEEKTLILPNADAAAWSSNGQQIAMLRHEQNSSDNALIWRIYIQNSENGDERKIFEIESAEGYIAGIAWSPDNIHIAFLQGQRASLQENITSVGINILDTTTNEIIQVGAQNEWLDNLGWSPNGKMISFTHSIKVGTRWADSNFIIARPDGTCAFSPLNITNIEWSSWSPDSRKIVFYWNSGIYMFDISTTFGNEFIATGPNCP